MTFEWFWPEGIYALAMILVFVLGAFACKLPIAIAMAAAAVVAAAISGFGFPIRHLVEGMFGYIDTILIIATAMIFMNTVQAIGLLEAVAARMIRTFRSSPVLLSIGMMILVMIPGMLTGSSTACVLTTGALVAPVMIRLGVSIVKTAAFIAMGALLGMTAPPVNIPVMIIGGGIDMPYVGFAIPLLIATVPMALFVIFAIAVPALRSSGGIDEAALEDELRKMEAAPLSFRLFIPFLVLIVLMACEQFMPGKFPSLGMPLQFMIATLSAFLTGRRWNVLESATNAVRDAIPVLGILMGVGMFIQIMTLTGVRGWVVVSALSIPAVMLYISIAISLPAFGAISSFGAASVLGVPFILSLLSKDQILVASGLALVASLGDLVPPTALAGIFAAQVVGEKDYFKVLRQCVVPGIVIAVWGILMIAFANEIAAAVR